MAHHFIPQLLKKSYNQSNMIVSWSVLEKCKAIFRVLSSISTARGSKQRKQMNYVIWFICSSPLKFSLEIYAIVVAPEDMDGQVDLNLKYDICFVYLV